MRKINLPKSCRLRCNRGIKSRIAQIVSDRKKYLEGCKYDEESGAKCKACKDWKNC